MKRILCGALGLLVGGYLTTLSGGGCSCPPGPRSIPLIGAGTYSVNPQRQMGADTNYKLVVSADQTQVTETFVRGGILYENVYRITGTSGN